eukprot:gene14179-18102_t
MGVLGNGNMGFEQARFIRHWTNDLTLYTNGTSTLTPEQTLALNNRGIAVVENEISTLEHPAGKLENLVFTDGQKKRLSAVFARPDFRQHSPVPQQLGCELTEQGHIRVDDFQKTSVPGVYAAGDNTTMFRSISAAVAAGTKAGAMLNKELTDEEF